jgi:hypothetical protein
MKAEEMWALSFLILMVSSQAYHLCCLLFIASLEGLPKIHSLDSMVAKNWKNLDYKEWELN